MPENDPSVLTVVDELLDGLTGKLDAVEKVVEGFKKEIAELKAQVDKHTELGLLTESQLKKLKDAAERLFKLTS